MKRKNNGESSYLESLGNCIKAIAESEKPEIVLQVIASQTARQTGADECSVVLLGDKEIATVIASSKEARISDITINLKNYPEIRRAVEIGGPYIIEDVSHSLLLKDVAPFLVKKKIASIAVLPVFFENKLLGALLLRTSRVGNPLKDVPPPFLQSIDNILAVALRNFKLQAQIITKTQEKEDAQKQALKEEQYRQRFEELFHSASDGLLIINARGNVVEVNRKFEQLTGYSAKEALSLTYLELVTEEYHELAKNLLMEFRKKPIPMRAQLNIRTKQGEIKTIIINIEPLKTLKGQALLSIQDITEEQKLENQLRITKDFFENLIQSSVDAIIACDMKGSIIIFNEGAEKITGYKAEEVIGRMNIIDLYEPGGAKDAMRRLRSPQYGGVGKLESTNYNIISKSGESIPIKVSAAIIYEDGKEIASVGIFQDQRERIKIDAQMREIQAKLVESEKQAALAALSGATAHELNQPLTSILGYTEILLKHIPVGEEQCQKAAKTIHQEAERMADIIRKISNISTFHTKEYVGKAKILDLDKAAKQPADRYENLFMSLRDGLLEFTISPNFTIGECIFANPSAVQLFGYKSAADLLGVRLQELLGHSEASKKIEELLKEKGFFEDLVFSAKRRDGTEIYVSANANLLEIIKGGKALELVCRDVTSRVFMENEIRRLKEFNESIVNNAPIGILTLDKDGVVIGINDRDQEIMGLPSKELIVGKKLQELPNIKGTPLEENINRGLRGERIFIPSFDFTSITGKRLTLKAEGVPLKDEKGNVVGGIILIDDITEEKRAQLEFETVALISREGVKAKKMDVLYQILVTQLRRILSPDVISLVTIRPSGTEFEYEVLYADESFSLPRKGVFPVKGSATAEIIESGKTFLVADLQKERNLKFDEKVVQKLGIRSVICAPLLARDKKLGELYIGSYKENLFSAKDEQFLLHLANEFAMVLENLSLLEELKKKNAELELKTSYLEKLLIAGRVYKITMNETEIVKRFISNVEQIFPSPHVLVSLKDPREDVLVPVYTVQLPEGSARKKINIDAKLKRLITSGMDFIYYPKLEKTSDYQPEMDGAKSALLLPLRTEDTFLGLLKLESHHTEIFSESDIDLLILLAQQLTSALNNTRLFEQTKLLEKQQLEMIENANALISAVDSNGKVVIYNRAFEQFTGYSKEEVIGKSLFDLFRIELDSQGVRNFATYIRSSEPLKNFEFRFKKKNGEYIKGVFNISLQKDAHGKVQRYIFVGYDITDRENLEKQLVHSAKMATLGQMAAGVAHELSNPLTYISSFSQLLLRDWEKRMNSAQEKGEIAPLKDVDIERVKNILKGVDRISQLLSNLLSFSRKELERAEKLDINLVIEQALSFSEYELSQGKVKIIKKLTQGLPPVLGVAGNLQQVIINLLSNASKAVNSVGGGEVVITSSSTNGEVLVEISDNGPGIPPKILGKIFEPFFTTQPRGKGTGLGLSIAQSIVHNHGGEISVKSEVGKGTTFTITLPAVRENSKE